MSIFLDIEVGFLKELLTFLKGEMRKDEERWKQTAISYVTRIIEADEAEMMGEPPPLGVNVAETIDTADRMG